MTETDDGHRPRVLLTAATGYTGGLVARELASADLPFLLTSRSPGALAARAEQLGGPPTRTVDVTEPAGLRDVLRPGDVVINCAGPFTDLGEPVVRCCVEAGAHYLDTTGEQTFMKRVADRHHEAAREAGVAVVNGMAFEYALGDAAAALSARALDGPPARLDIVYGWRGEAASTPGTRASIVRTVSRRGWALEDGRWRREPVARRRRRVRLPDGPARHALSFPAGEVVTVPRHLDVDTVRGWMIAGRSTVAIARILSPVLAPAARLAEPLLDRAVRRGPDGPTLEQRRAGRFDILATASDGAGGRRSVVVSGRDPYGLTAALIVRGARALLARSRDGGPAGGEAAEAGGGQPAGEAASPDASGSGTPDAERPPAGVLAPSQVVEPAALLDGLDRFDLAWREAPDAGPVS